MTNPAPGTAPLNVGDFLNRIKAALQNRAEVSESASNPEMRPSAWTRDALRELTANYPFPELQTNGPLVTIGPGKGWQGSNYMYPVSLFLNPGDDVTLQEDPVIFLNGAQAATVGIPGVAATTSNIVGYPMDYLSPKAIQSLLFIPGGIPFKYTRYGNMFWFGSQPGQPYNVYLPYQVRHPFQESLISSPVRIPADWYDILAYAAAERGAINLRWNDQATYLHNVLYGDPEYQKSGGVEGRPGLIAGRIFQQERDKRLSPVQILVGSQRY